MDKRLITDKGLVALIDRGDGTYDIGVAASAGELGRESSLPFIPRSPKSKYISRRDLLGSQRRVRAAPLP